ncbi:hypothetical protein WG947_09540 [Pontibacter sp. H259]|uniref:hypothetical protein n=1 Tax=Pontibacter sp. H259 TaxID=3133421 RepID=UPI0030C35DE4
MTELLNTTTKPEPVTLQPEVVYQDSYVRIEADSKAKYIFVDWLQHPDSASFRHCFSKAVSFTVDMQCEYWLSDARAIHYLEFADQNWLLEEILPILPNSKLKKFARISTVESIALMDVARIYSSMDKLSALTIKTQTEVFINKEDALEWLFPVA